MIPLDIPPYTGAESSAEGVGVDVDVVNEESFISYAEDTYNPRQHYPLLFLRVNGDSMSLKNHSSALELFSKLRSALGYHSENAPWLETSLADWQKALSSVRMQSDRVLLMVDEIIAREESDRSEWIIPDPCLMVEVVELKRPTWELLKEWKNRFC